MHFDAIIVGSGAGGSAAAYYLVQSGRRVLLLERGPELPRDGSTLDVEQVFGRQAFVETERWTDGQGHEIVPEERSNLGGKTRWYGAALLRFGRDEFAGDAQRQLLPWPIAADELTPFYEAAEQLLGVRTFPVEPELARIADHLTGPWRGWDVRPLPLGLSAAILDHPDEAKHFDGFASPRGLKSDGQSAFLERVRRHPNLVIATGRTVTDVIASDTDPTRAIGVVCDDGTVHRAQHVLLAAGALHSPRLLQSYFERTGLGRTLPSANLVGRNYKSHVLTAVLAFSPRRKTDLLRKTALFLHDDFPRSSVQPLGWFDGEFFSAIAPSWLPKPVARFVGPRLYGFFLQTEDGSHPDNRVVAHAHGIGRPRLDYDLARIPHARDEHRGLVTRFNRDLLAMGLMPLSQSIPVTGTAHACGTLVAGNDPGASVVGPDGRVHGMRNLYVVDGSVLPRSSRVNPALTIYAWSLRVASGLVQRIEQERTRNEQSPARAGHPVWA
jgi:choline dehydrogenase-like flavoprotein